MKRIYKLLLPLLLPVISVHLSAQTVVAEYTFSGNTKDLSANANDASNHGATFTADRFGVANSAMLFDGVQSYVVAPNSSTLMTPTTSVSFWVRVDDLPDAGESFLLSNGGWQERWKISLPSHGKPVWTTNHTNGISDMDSGDNPLVEGTWAHLVMVHDGAKDLIYLNGTLAAEKDVVGTLNSTSHPLGIGYDPIDGANFFTGAIDDVTIYDGALDAGQVSALFTLQSTPPVFGPGLVASYSFSNNLRDDSEYRNHALGTDIEYTTDRFGFGNSAVEFNGETSGAYAPNSAPLNSATTTVSFWVKVNSLPGSGESYIASFGGWQERWKISLPSHGKVVWTTHATTCCSDLDAGGGNELQVGEWMHAVFVHDGTKDKIFINGVLANEKDAPGDLNTTTHPLGMGYDPIDNANYFDGALDEFQIYNYALSDTDIANLYAEQSTTIIDPDPLVLNLPFSGDFKDASQFRNDAEGEKAELTYDRFGFANNAASLSNEATLTVDNSTQYNSAYTTVSFWVNMDELPGTGEVYLMSFGGWQERWKLSLPSHGKVVWTTNHTGGISDMDAGDGNALVPGNWTHVVAVHDALQDKIFINGVLANSKNVGNALNSTTHDLGIGWNPVDGGNFMNGDIDEVRIYNIALTDQEVADLYALQSVAPVFLGTIVAEYPLDASGTDISPFHNHGDVFGAVAALDRHGRANHAMDFDGVDDNIVADNSPQLNTPVTSVSFWINPATLPANGEAYILTFGGWQERWKISLPTHGKPVWTTNHENGISDMDSGDGNELVVGDWTHLVMVHDGLKDYIYINGVLAAEKDVVGLLDNTSHPLGIGYNAVDGGSYFDGKLDDIQIYNVALTGTEVAALYAAQAADPGESDITAPETPANLIGTVEFTNVTLMWTASFDEESGLAGYNVYQNSSLILTTEGTETTISGLAPLTFYEFGVSAVDSAGNESGVTSIIVLTGMDETPDTEAPTTPANLVVSPGANSAVFSWDPSLDNVGVAGYVVSVDGVFVDSLPGDQTSIFIGGLESETLYAFEVYAFDFAGNNSEQAFIVASTTEPVVTAEPGLVAHYKFEGNANDETPYSNHGAIGGNPTFEPATHGHAGGGLNIDFDGDQDSVLVPNAVQLISDYATVSFWVRPDDQNLADAESYILDFGHWDERWKVSLPQHLKVVWTTNSKNAQFDHFISDMDSGDGNELVLGFWWYVTMVHDGTDDIIYLDGVEVNRKPVVGTLNSTARPLGIGNNPIDGGQYFIGGLDEVKIYNKALTSDEIAQLYETGTTGTDDLNAINEYVEIIYPNPTKDDLLIRHGFEADDLLIRVYDNLGRQVSAHKTDAAQMSSGVISLNVADLQAGMYNLNFVLGGKNLGSIPFVKQ